jgi:hypothetical protein
MPVPMMAPMPSKVSLQRPQLADKRVLLGSFKNLVERLDSLEQHQVIPRVLVHETNLPRAGRKPATLNGHMRRAQAPRVILRR